MAAPSAIVLILTAAASVAAAWVGLERVADRPDMVSLVALAPGSLAYRASGEFLADGVPVNAPLVPVAFARGIAIMTRQVSDAEYRRCVSAGACKPLENESADGIDTLPVVGIDWNDAIADARWLSTVTGHRYRLPTDSPPMATLAIPRNAGSPPTRANRLPGAAPTSPPIRSAASARTGTGCSISPATSGSGPQAVTSATQPTAERRKPKWRTAGYTSSKAATAPISATSFAIHAAEPARSVRHRATSESVWSETTTRA